MSDKDSVPSFASSLEEFQAAPTLRFLEAKIERLPVSADIKSILLDVASVTLTVGGKVLSIGRKILAVVFELAGKFRNIAFGVIIALALSAVIASIPLLGGAISALLGPLMLAFGIARGALEDFKNIALQSELDGLKQRMMILSANAVL